MQPARPRADISHKHVSTSIKQGKTRKRRLCRKTMVHVHGGLNVEKFGAFIKRVCATLSLGGGGGGGGTIASYHGCAYKMIITGFIQNRKT